jgi:hypothetical protein
MSGMMLYQAVGSSSAERLNCTESVTREPPSWSGNLQALGV